MVYYTAGMEPVSQIMQRKPDSGQKTFILIDNDEYPWYDC